MENANGFGSVQAGNDRKDSSRSPPLGRRPVSRAVLDSQDSQQEIN